MMKHNILKNLEYLSKFFEEHQDNRWKNKIDNKIHEIQNNNNDKKYPSILRDLFGTYGTLNDLAILKKNGHKVENEIEANEQLEKLISGLKDELSKIDNEWYKKKN